MGRPRKRPREESDEKPLAAAPPTKTMTEKTPDTEDPGMEFINILLETEFDLELIQSIQPLEETTMTSEINTPTCRQPFYTSFGEVDFDSQPAEDAPMLPFANIDPALFIEPTAFDSPSMDQLPALSPANSNTSSSPPSTNPTTATSSLLDCNCMAKLYSALNWMQKLPDEVEPAIRLARLAAKTAYEVVNCNKCGSALLPTIQHKAGSPYMMMCFQNMMLLGTLIPSIVHAYAKMLNIVDEETSRAIAERRKMAFKLNGLGGIWGAFDAVDDELCGAKRNFAYKEMEPVMWRLTVRALLKIDVYGMSSRCAGGGDVPAGPDPFHLGLKDIVTLMEDKARARHSLMDTMVNAGVCEQTGCLLGSGNPGEPPTCQRIISIARSSVENLCIA